MDLTTVKIIKMDSRDQGIVAQLRTGLCAAMDCDRLNSFNLKSMYNVIQTWRQQSLATF